MQYRISSVCLLSIAYFSAAGLIKVLDLESLNSMTPFPIANVLSMPVHRHTHLCAHLTPNEVYRIVVVAAEVRSDCCLLAAEAEARAHSSSLMTVAVHDAAVDDQRDA
jgi:hypothetical protein